MKKWYIINVISNAICLEIFILNITFWSNGEITQDHVFGCALTTLIIGILWYKCVTLIRHNISTINNNNEILTIFRTYTNTPIIFPIIKYDNKEFVLLKNGKVRQFDYHDINKISKHAGDRYTHLTIMDELRKYNPNINVHDLVKEYKEIKY